MIIFAVNFNFLLNLFYQIFIRIRNLLLYPTKEWAKIAEESDDQGTIYLRFIVPLLCLWAVATIIGTWIATPRELYSTGYVFYAIFKPLLAYSAGLFLSAFIINALLAQHIGYNDRNRTFALIAYSSAIACLIFITVAMIPYLSELLILSIYSGYIYWQGLSQIFKTEEQERISYGLLSALIILFIFALTYFFFNNFLLALFKITL